MVTLGPGSALAADPLQSITASPSSQRLDLGPTSSYEGTINITDTGQTPYSFRVSTSPFSVSGETYTQSFVARPDLVDASKWFSFGRSSFSVQPGESVPVTYHIKTPPDIAAGSYYAVVFAEADAPSSAKGQSITARKRVGIIFYLTVTGKTVSGGNVASYTVSALQTEPPLEAALRIQNTGNVDFNAEISVVVSDIFGNTKARLDSTNLIFPKSTRRISLQWREAPAFGLFKISGNVHYLGKTEPLPTRYTLMLSSTAFVLMFLVAIAIIGFYVLSRRRHSNVTRRHH
jgi:hypothetical protein